MGCGFSSFRSHSSSSRFNLKSSAPTNCSNSSSSSSSNSSAYSQITRESEYYMTQCPSCKTRVPMLGPMSMSLGTEKRGSTKIGLLGLPCPRCMESEEELMAKEEEKEKEEEKDERVKREEREEGWGVARQGSGEGGEGEGEGTRTVR
ncbi:hypothetical protein EX30DRAFT_208921 [Ascodesmis nigricans]|uniref:Uncharacterized protein n=1 Tax=Ascodesmis nigricans TaxID=341454 RepID=A0A4V3SHR3_9PEZI|nr:hypothetical protein EX30DRAFT_208921 [Ascodesmis nigricans]